MNKFSLVAIACVAAFASACTATFDEAQSDPSGLGTGDTDPKVPPQDPCFTELLDAVQCVGVKDLQQKAVAACSAKKGTIDKLELLGASCGPDMDTAAKYRCCVGSPPPPPPPMKCFSLTVGEPKTCYLDSELEAMAQTACGKSNAKMTAFVADQACPWDGTQTSTSAKVECCY